jgi:hypothetical protein
MKYFRRNYSTIPTALGGMCSTTFIHISIEVCGHMQQMRTISPIDAGLVFQPDQPSGTEIEGSEKYVMIRKIY